MSHYDEAETMTERDIAKFTVRCVAIAALFSTALVVLANFAPADKISDIWLGIAFSYVIVGFMVGINIWSYRHPSPALPIEEIEIDPIDLASPSLADTYEGRIYRAGYDEGYQEGLAAARDENVSA